MDTFDKLVTDNGPHLANEEFRKIASDYGFVHNISSPHYSQSMGQADRYVQTEQNMIKKHNDSYR